MNHGKHCETHNHCDHCLHFCQTCNATYCCKCGEEWGKGSYCYPFYPYQSPTWPNPYWYVTCNDQTLTTTGGTFTADASCIHSHSHSA